ncbi:protein-disulfide reductase DsbD domain-containing protein [Chitinophaga sp. Cy-1792]|uniref:protein-disulfide reductase DsbD domain-containing protein n=1 Tax=Chitinophaga sp. Cy-1792 TaxID=2608339 RepID=UPI0014208B93|nr:protein-disulfide reductase DsbD domain-containing protein [Chitinophaga sp. Cy-1792]NIG56783.1 hypothetical protein [Chitinophaga sp. Cy-1792]
MKQLLSVLFFCALPFFAVAQIENPVNWNFSSKKINANTYEIHMTAIIDAGWHIYAQESGEGPIPTSFSLMKNAIVTPAGKVLEQGSLKKVYDTNYKTDLKYYEHKVDFVQQVKVKGTGSTKLKGTVEFMACDDHQCLPAKKVDFAISIGGK